MRTQVPAMRAYTSDEALALYVDCKETKHSYKLHRKRAMDIGHCIYPSYYSLQKAKTLCCPAEEFINITDIGAEISLQAILDLTATRLLTVQEDVLKRLLSLDITEFKLTSKWGCDGSSGHSRYKQKFSDASNDDENLCIFTFVPIKVSPIDQQDIYVWQNTRPSSTRLCRPIKFLFAKETDNLIRRETKLIEEQISTLRPITLVVGDSEVTVHYEMLLTMIDGKVCNSVSETRSSQSCYICGATPKQMNLLTEGDTEDTPEYYAFGLSPLHSWIRSFECLLHISYKLDVKKWQVRDGSEKKAVQQRKANIQERFHKEMGLIVDRPKPGFGSTNDGNTARRFFKNAEQSADITGLDKNIIDKFRVILQAISSGYAINIEEFAKYVNQTRELYLKLYSWYYMPVTVHKLFMHSAKIISSCIVPIGQLSEEAQEARNKDCRRFRMSHTRKRSRTATNRDLLTMLLVSSDPVINNFRELPQKPLGTISRDVLSLLKCPDIPSQPQKIQNTFPNTEEDYLVEDSSASEFSSDDSDID